MSENKHTPGPWISTGGCFQYEGDRVCDHSVSTEWTRGQYPELGYRDDPYSVDNVTICSLGGFQKDVSEDELRANGNLIAATPDLYEAASEAFEYFMREVDHDPTDTALNLVMDKLTDALWKARGENQ